ncbi:M20/M25/M40 family metallo-hydrolase [Sorangium sp. So ce1014]|uniref:M20/M25/M40 family metallo-hydrolase n=1 Tax=Sorangium sp. So ce1014 TaxID=3133326 RepID=UPI003F5E8F15
MLDIDRRTFLVGAAAAGALASFPRLARGAGGKAVDLSAVYGKITEQLNPSIERIQRWIQQPSISAQNVGITECCELTMELLRDAGFGTVKKMKTDGHPGIFATLDAGAKQTMGFYFMYDVQPVEEKEWSSPPFAARLVDKAGIGKVIVGRGAVNQKGPQGAFLAALHAVRAAGLKLPVNLVVVAEGEEELGSPHFSQVVWNEDVMRALETCQGVIMPSAQQSLSGTVNMDLGAKGIVYVELGASGKAWGRGPREAEIHSSMKVVVDSPVWRLVQALGTLVSADGNEPRIDGLTDAVRPVSRQQKILLDDLSARWDEADWKNAFKVDRWVNDLEERAMLERYVSRPSVNIDGLYAGYIGEGSQTILPHRAFAKMDIRLVPDMTAKDVLAKLRKHLDRRGYTDIVIKDLGSYDPTNTALDAPPIQTQLAVYKAAGLDPVIWPRVAGSWPGYLFTGKPLERPAGHVGLGHGSGAHAKDEYFVVEPAAGKKYLGLDGATRSFVDFLFAL